MTQKEIYKKHQSINAKRLKLYNDLMDLQRLCQHPDATHKNKADTGNYDPSNDQYWTEHVCPDCGKHWTTDQDWNRK